MFKEYIYKVINGVGLPMRVYLPEKEADTAVLCIHGGAWRGAIKDNSPWDGSWMSKHAEYYAKNGKIGISISYRDLDLSEDTYTKEQIEDCRDAAKFIKELFADKKLYAIGDSAGAHLALCLGFSPDESLRPEKIAACNPVTDLVNKRWKDTGKTDENRRKISPLFMIDELDFSGEKKPAILCMHGDKDETVPLGDTVLFEKKLKEKGFKSEMQIIKDASHAFILWGYTAKDENVLSCMKKIDKFFFGK